MRIGAEYVRRRTIVEGGWLRQMRYLLWHLLDQAADADPGRAALRCADRELSYRGFAETTDRLARLLIRLGVRPGDRVGVLLPRSLEGPVAVYGILKAGAAFVPIDQQAPPGRIAQILSDCGIAVLIAEPGRRRALARTVREDTPLRAVVGLEELAEAPVQCLSWDEVAREESRAPGVPATEMDLAYIMYTSGSTGRAQGADAHPRQWPGLRPNCRPATYGVRPDDQSWATTHRSTSTMSTFEYLYRVHWWARTNGRRHPRRGRRPVPLAALAALIERERLTFWYSVPLALIQLLEQGANSKSTRPRGSLRWVTLWWRALCAGSSTSHSLAELWPGARFSATSYGPAEVNQCTVYNFGLADLDGDRPVPIGDVWPNTEALILDEDDREVPDGEVGQLLIRSATMMAGYWQRPDLSARAFHDHRRGPGPGARFYRTGDLVRRRADGLLDFLGRKDRQAKIRGQRVELEEVEAVLCAHTAVREACAFVLGEVQADRRVAAAILPAAGAEPDPREILKHAAAVLASHAAPKEVVIEDDFPRTGAGKVDRRAVAEAVNARLAAQEPS